MAATGPVYDRQRSSPDDSCACRDLFRALPFEIAPAGPGTTWTQQRTMLEWPAAVPFRDFLVSFDAALDNYIRTVTAAS